MRPKSTMKLTPLHILKYAGLANRLSDIERGTFLNVLQIVDLRKLYPYARIVGHRDFSEDKNGNGTIEPWEWIKACPCFDAKKEYRNV